CRQLGEWQRRQSSDRFVLRVNLSARQVAQPDLVPTVVSALDRAGVAPGSVCFEITETTLMSDAELSLAVLERLRGLGVELAIDGSFVDGVGDAPDDTSIVEAIVRLAEALGMSVTAEGVETETQRAELLRLGCVRAQGFLLGRPMPAEQFESLLG